MHPIKQSGGKYEERFSFRLRTADKDDDEDDDEDDDDQMQKKVREVIAKGCRAPNNAIEQVAEDNRAAAGHQEWRSR